MLFDIFKINSVKKIEIMSLNPFVTDFKFKKPTFLKNISKILSYECVDISNYLIFICKA